MAYIDWWNRTGPVTLGERFGLNEISIARNTLSPTKSYTEGGSARKNLEKGTSWTDFLNPGELLIRQPSEEEKIEFKEDLTKGVEFAKEKWKALWPELVKDFTPVQGEIRAKGYFDESLQKIAQAKKEKKYIEMVGHGVEGVVLGTATYPWWMGVPLGARLVSKFLRLGKKPATKIDFEKILGKGEKYQGTNIDKFTGTKNELKEIKKDIEKFSEKLNVPLSYFYKDSFGSISKKFFKGKMSFPTIVGIKGNKYLFRFNGIDETILEEIKLLL